MLLAKKNQVIAKFTVKPTNGTEGIYLENFVLSGSKVTLVPGTTSYSCNEGGALNEDVCTYTTYSCDTGTPDENNKCGASEGTAATPVCPTDTEYSSESGKCEPESGEATDPT